MASGNVSFQSRVRRKVELGSDATGGEGGHSGMRGDLDVRPTDGPELAHELGAVGSVEDLSGELAATACADEASTGYRGGVGSVQRLGDL
ncbi:hypothetical protein [Amycolatopsis sp. NPDC059657]|uniref:hypothetical protein n=1 Tax=Amycolatopsis sp. NPDC059657 TaxID=3346899 RepID=UPI00367049FD